MIHLEYQLLAAFVLDLLLGDPRWLPHPVRIIGRLALALETPLRRRIRNARAAGVVAAVLVVGSAGLLTWLLLRVAAGVHPLAGDIVAILLLYTTLATRDLLRHSQRVYHALCTGSLPAARQAVAMLVGRDTYRLDEPDVVRAAVESVAENLVDGVTAPLFFAALGGPVAAMMYKAASTLDSTFGYKSERYLFFGWASARLDDVANFLPARLTVPLLTLGAALTGFRPLAAWRVAWRDGRQHASPNAGLAEAAMAGALGVRLGGLNYYDGEPCQCPYMGQPVCPLRARVILSANVLAFVSALLFLLAGVAVRIIVG